MRTNGIPVIYEVVGTNDTVPRLACSVSGVSEEAVLDSPTGLCSVSPSNCPTGCLLVASSGAQRVAFISRAFSYAYSSFASAMEAIRCGLGVLIHQRGILKSEFDADADAINKIWTNSE